MAITIDPIDTIVNPTPLDEIPKLVKHLETTFLTNKTRSLSWRRDQLQKLHDLMIDKEDLIREALWKDLRKDISSVRSSDNRFVASEAAHALACLDEWTTPVPAKKSLFSILDSNKTLMHPLGVVCIIGTWNYPVQLLLGPMVAAIAAGNCVLLKPSEVATHTEAFLLEWIPKTFDNDAIKIMAGSVREATVLLDQKFDHIFYTGNEHVARIILKAAAKNLTPVTLELGGKCPVYVHHDTNLEVAARRIVWGKFFNNGQTCIAPDYVLVHEKVEVRFLQALKAAVVEMYGNDAKLSDDYGRVVNDNHTQRLCKILDRQLALPHSQVVTGGVYDKSDKYISPTIISNVEPMDPIMEDELFGPLLAVTAVDSELDALKRINRRGHPLCFFIFASSKPIIDTMISNTRSGSVMVNDFLANMIFSDLPFGGTGSSGMGNYHGKHGFLTFSNQRAMVWRGTDLITEQIHSLVYPPVSNTPFALRITDIFLMHHAPWDITVAFRTYVPVKLILCVGVVIGAFFVGRAVGQNN
ncbi:hypothetical protein HDU98_005786 [Podochytrium sp. JEL0797]|nr:hypothetical protein HDU98_005786 [Podochytrium sp. JEL0797]